MRQAKNAFTLVELLVVIGIIALLISILLPSLAGARQSANNLKCISNVRQLATALTMYAVEYKRFPPNVNTLGATDAEGKTYQYWYDYPRIGRYLPKTYQTGTGSIGGPIFICPNDSEGLRSYAMNYWASCLVDGSPKPAPPSNSKGTPITPGSKDASAMMLIGEGYTKNGPAFGGYFCSSTIGGDGNFTTPGQRFGGIATYTPGGRYAGQISKTEIAYFRHRKAKSTARGLDPVGQTAIGFADGHAEMLSNEDLYTGTAGNNPLSTLRAKWSPLDPQINK